MRQVLIVAGLVFGLIIIGTVGLRLIEGARWLDCLYMTAITITTVGYEEVVPLSDAGRVFIMLYLGGSVAVFTYSAFQVGQWVVDVQLNSQWRKRRMQHAINRLEGHYVVCGLGRMGTTICEYLHERKQPFVVIDTDEQQLISASAPRGWLYVVGDAANDDILKAAGIQRAVSLASVLPTDSDNVYVVLSARLLNSKLQIVVAASDDRAAEKLVRAGATRVVSPFSTGAVKMARFMLHPSIEDFLEIADVQGQDLELAEVQIRPGSPYIGKKIVETDLAEKGVMIIGIRRATGERLVPPPPSAIIEVGDSLFAFCSSRAVNKMVGESEHRESK